MKIDELIALISMLGVIVLAIIIVKPILNNKHNSGITFLSVIIVIILLLCILSGNYMIFLNPYFTMTFGVFAFFVIKKLILKLRNLGYTVDSYNDIQQLHRDIDIDYTPSVASYLFEEKLEYKDLFADLLDLYAKKIINIENISNGKTEEFKINLEDNNYRLNITNPSNIYLIESFVTKSYTFDFKKWRKLILEKFNSESFKIKEKKKIPIEIIMTVLILLTFTITIIAAIFTKSGWLTLATFALLVFSTGIILYAISELNKDEKFYSEKLSEHGKEEIKKWIKFRKFLKEYTNIKDRKVEETILYESYIPYAIALGVNLNYKDTKFDMLNNKNITEVIKEFNADEILKIFDSSEVYKK